MSSQLAKGKNARCMCCRTTKDIPEKEFAPCTFVSHVGGERLSRIRRRQEFWQLQGSSFRSNIQQDAIEEYAMTEYMQQ